MFITLTGIQGACIYINPEHIAAMPYTGGGKTPVYCATSGAHYQVLETPEQILALIEAEKRRLRGTREHRKCPCGGLGGIKKMHGKYWAECNNCECSTDTFDTPEEAWAAWDGVE